MLLRPRSIQEEIGRYKDLIEISEALNFQAFWKANSKELPILSNIVIEYAIMCATSIYSESTFSESGAIIGKHRTSLKPLTVRYQMNLKDKFDLLEKLQINIYDYLE